MKTWISAAALAMTAAAPGFAQDTPEALAEAFVAAVEAEDAQALGALYADDADSYGPGTHHVRGREAIVADWQAFFDAFDAIDLDLDMHGSAHMDDTHAAWGVWSMTLTSAEGGEPFVMTGRLMDVQRRIDGRWQYIADHASASPPPAE